MEKTKKSPRKKPAKQLADSHKRALVNGRLENKVVRDYLTFLKTNAPKRGRKRTIHTVKSQLEAVNEMLSQGINDPVLRLKASQRRLDLERELQAMTTETVNPKKLETDFIKVAASYSKRLGISRAAWLSMGVPAQVLKTAGIK